jgi:hypothetical protein
MLKASFACHGMSFIFSFFLRIRFVFSYGDAEVELCR